MVGRDARTSPRLPLALEQMSQVRSTGAALAVAFARAADQSGAELVKASEASAGHYAAPWVTGYQLGNPFRGGPVPYHPNLAGMTAVADLVVDRLRRNFGLTQSAQHTEGRTS